MKNTTGFWPVAPDLRRSDIAFHFRGHDYLGHMVAPAETEGPKPMVMVTHNYQGLKFFDVDVAEYIARLGYVGFAIDLYGDRVPANERLWPEDESQVLAFQQKCFEAMVALDHDHELFRALFKAWLDQGMSHNFVDASIAPAAIGYCFGGVAVLEAVRGGLGLGGVVSLHGLLQTGEDPNPARFNAERPPLKSCENNYNTQTIVVVENGADDELVPDDSKQRFFNEMNEAGTDWIFHHYAATPHGFALPPTLGPPGRLHESTDRRSTMNMLNLFREIFPSVRQNPVSHNASGTSIPL
ncbi:dienelactone hydrolase family protein [Pseudomonadales bacterium]|nr:dienelactone hydrolase family protein [Pseudomonadales bacterium]MDC0994254.1 dienelactone hydrolase family protein [Pseudomonadales bacterium]MDC3358093.1 dienelactone hydrolase family protein [Pseudomonadales bacterium]